MSMPALAHFVGLERSVWDALVAADTRAVSELLADDFVGVYPTGFADRGEYLAQLANGPTVAEYSVNRPFTQTFGDDAVLLGYEARYRRAAGAELEIMYVSSTWCRREGRWVNTFSQDTPRGEPVP